VAEVIPFRQFNDDLGPEDLTKVCVAFDMVLARPEIAAAPMTAEMVAARMIRLARGGITEPDALVALAIQGLTRPSLGDAARA
jgi:hypothetical protein